MELLEELKTKCEQMTVISSRRFCNKTIYTSTLLEIKPEEKEIDPIAQCKTEWEHKMLAEETDEYGGTCRSKITTEIYKEKHSLPVIIQSEDK